MTPTMRTFFSNILYSVLGLLLVLIVCYYWIDIPVALWVANNPIPAPVISISYYFATIFKSANWLVVAIVSGMLGLYARYLKHNAEHAHALLFFATSVIVAYGLCFVLKILLARYRPYMLIGHGLYGFHLLSLRDTINSMPSGHTTCSFAGLYALSIIFHRNWLTICLLTLGIIIALSRIILLLHYPSDVIFGAYLGIVSVLWIQILLRYRNKA